MKVLLQRVTKASVTVDSQVVGSIGAGLLLLVGIAEDDTLETVKTLSEKIVNLRVFAEDAKKFHRSLLEVSGEVLVVSQFTLYADTTKGRRPEFFKAAQPEHAKALYLQFIEKLKNLKISKVEAGVFGAHMKVELLNDGPVTIMLDSAR